MSARPKYEHPDDWNMHEGDFAKRCSQLGYRLLTLADVARDLDISEDEKMLTDRIAADIRRIGG